MATVNITAIPLSVTTSLSAGLPAMVYAEPFITTTDIGATTTPFVYIVDSGNNRVQAFSYAGVFQFSFGTYGSGNGQFDNPYGIANDGTYLYVTDRGNSRVEVFDLYGVYQSQFGSTGTTVGLFDTPLGIATDNNYIYVVDSNNSRVQIFAKDGTFIYSYGEYGSGDGQLDHPTDIADDDYYIYIDDTGNNRTVILAKNLNFVQYIIGALPALEASFSAYSNSIELNVELPALEAEISSLENNVGTINAELPALTAQLSGGDTLKAELPALNADIKLITGSAIELNAVLPVVSSTIKANDIEYGNITSELPPLSVDLRIANGNICTLAIQLPVLSGTLTAQVGSAAVLEAELPTFDTDFAVVTGSMMTMDISLPPLSGYLVLKNVAVTTTYKGIVINMKTGAVTEYDNFNFNSVVEYKGSYLTASDNGIYLLTGDTDDNSNINAHFRTGTIDRDNGIVNIPEEMWVKGENGNMTLDYTLDNSQTISLSINPVNSSILGTRVKLPKGVKNRFADFSVKNNSGSDFKIQSLRLMAYPIRRKAR